MPSSSDLLLADLLSRMTLTEKIGQVGQVAMRYFAGREEERDAGLRSGRWGSRILAETAWAGNNTNAALDVEELNAQQRLAVEESRLGIPLLFGRDVIYGHRTVCPIPLSQAASFNPGLVERAITCVAREAAADGVHWTFSPMLDLVRDPRWGRVIESFGEDPHLLCEMGRATIRGFQGDDPSQPDRLLACAKHFAGYGGSEGGRDYDSTEWTDDTLHNMILPAFRMAAEEGVASFMSGFNQLGGSSVSASRKWMQSWLKDGLGWDGFIVSDWGSVLDLVGHRQAADRREAARLAFNAGVDMDMVDGLYEQHLASLIAAGEVSEARLDDAVLRILRAKQRAGLFDRPRTEARPDVQRAPEHRALALELATQSIVLLKNDGILPLACAAPQRIAVLGPYAEATRQHLGSWCLDGRPSEVCSILDGLRAAAPGPEFITANPAFADELIAAARGADLCILCVGESHVRNGENKSIATLTLPAGQEELIDALGALAVPLVVVDCSGRYLPIPAAERHARALLHAGHLGTEAGAAIARVLLGLAQPSGKLPMSIPRVTGQIPVHYNRKSNGKIASIGAAYKGYEDLLLSPLYPFGFGLTYTRFDLEDVRLSADTLSPGGTLAVHATLHNRGEHPGTEVLQLYLQDEAASITRPERELKAFQRIELLPGQHADVRFDITGAMLGFYTPYGQWTLEPGTFRLGLGTDSRCPLSLRFSLS